MNALFWKDIRLLRGVLIGAVALTFAVDVLIPTFEYFDDTLTNTEYHRPNNASWMGSFVHDLQGVSFYWGLAALLCGIIGAMAFAWERSEGWGDFIGILPISRRRIVMTKLRASLLIAFGLFVASALLTTFAGMLIMEWRVKNGIGATSLMEPNAFLQQAMLAAVFAMTAGLLVFGCGWLFSAILKSPVIAVGVAFGVVGAILIFQNTNRFFDHPYPQIHGQTVTPLLTPAAACDAVIGIVFLGIGIVSQLRRQSP